MAQGSSNPITLSDIEINPYKLETHSPYGGGGYSVRPGISRDHYLRHAQQIAHERRLESAFNLVIEATENLKPTLAADYTLRLQQLPSIIFCTKSYRAPESRIGQVRFHNRREA